MSAGLHLGNLATGTGWGGNLGDYGLIFIGTVASCAIAWFSMTNWGFEQFQSKASNALHWSRIRTYIYWLKKTRTSQAERWKAELSYIFNSVWLGTLFRVRDKVFEKDVTSKDMKEAEQRYAMAMEYSSYVQAAFAYTIGALFFLMSFFTWYTLLYDNASAIGPNNNLAGWVIAMIVLVCVTIVLHKTATILCFVNWFFPRVAGYILEFITIFIALFAAICAAVACTTEAWGFLGVAIPGFLLAALLAIYFIWLLVHARIVLALFATVEGIDEVVMMSRKSAPATPASE